MVDAIKLINNNYNNKNPATELSINQSNRAYVLDSVDWGAIQSTRVGYKFINQIGTYVTNTTLESRTISIIGWVVADTVAQMESRKRFLNNFVSPLQKLVLQYKTYAIEGIPDTTIKYGSILAENNEVMCKFMISLFCPDPLFHEATSRIVTLADWLPKFVFPMISPQGTGLIMGLRTPSVIVTVDNPGSNMSGMVVTFTAKGTVVNPYLIDIASQKQIRFDHTMEPGETLQVTTYPNRKTVRKITGGVYENVFNYLDFAKNEFIQLSPGPNYLRYGADENIENIEVQIEYQPQYQEVQE